MILGMAHLPSRYLVVTKVAIALTAQITVVHHLADGAYAAGDDLDKSVQRWAKQLHHSWSSDPSTASLPFPHIDLLPAGTGVLQACSGSQATDDPGSVGIFCPSSARVLLNRTILALRFKKDDDSAIPYWIATALAESFLNWQSGTPSHSQAAANLQANCLAGVLIAAAPEQKLADPRKQVWPALAAYNRYYNKRTGTPPQRAYALLTGFGATEASCSDVDMTALASGRVPDPDVLDLLKQIKNERASDSVMAVLGSRCRPRPQASCPRRVGWLKVSGSHHQTPPRSGR
jgi:hypothetical protein